MNDERRFTRRDALKAGAAIAGAGALEAANLAAFAQAWAQASPLEAREGRQAAAAALEALRAVRGRRLHGAGRRIHQGDRGAGHGAERVAGRRAAQGLGGGQHRPGPGHLLGPVLAAAPVPGQVHGRHRRRRLSRQEIRRLGRQRGHLRQVGQGLDRDPGGLQRQRHQLPPEHDREGGLQGDPEGHRGLHGTDEGAQGEERRRAASRSAAPRATAMPGCTGACGRSAATWSTRRTR